MAMVSFTSASTGTTNKLSSHTISLESNKTPNHHHNTHLRDVSFSSYLNSADETFVRKLADTSRNMITSQEEHISLARNKEEDGEIGVFGAEKYFNGRMDEGSPKVTTNNSAAKRQQQQYKKHETSDVKPRSVHHGTPSTRSESSWNSQSALLQSAMSHPSLRKAKRVQARSFLGSLSCKCVCSDKNSVDIVEEEQHGEISLSTSTRYGEVHARDHHPINTVPESPIKPQPDSWTKEEAYMQKMDKLVIGHNKDSSFSLPNLNPPCEPNLPIRMNNFQLDVDDQKERKSLEVFGSPVLDKRNKSLNIETRLAKLAWEANPRVLEEMEYAENGVYLNDSASDASSDLFEIESLTGKANPFVSRQASDHVPSGCVTPTTCYAPSEASIEWSVVTASAADHYSVLSDWEEQRRPATITTHLPSPIKTFSPISTNETKSSKEVVQRRRPNILLSCKSHKSVRVAGDAYMASDKVHADHSPRTRFQGGNKMTGFDSRQQHGLAKHQLTRSHSPRASHLLYIQ